MFMKKIKHKDYLTYTLPSKWHVEYNNDNLTLYCDNGNGAITISFFSLFELKETMDTHISIMAKKFIDTNHITLHNPLIIQGSAKTKLTLYGIGRTEDNEFFKLWVVAKYPHVLVATYSSSIETSEVKVCDNIIKSIQFII